MMVLAIDFSALVKYMIFLNVFGLITVFADVDFFPWNSILLGIIIIKGHFRLYDIFFWGKKNIIVK